MIPNSLFAVTSMTSPSMVLRDRRLREAKSHADKNQRELSRDRQTLERKEKQLMAECKRLALKGDMHGAKLVANQIARYRQIHDRNLAASVAIGTKSQAMISDHKVNKAEVETIKGFAYANMFESFTRMENREQRYAWRMNAINHLESSMRETMDEVYRGSGEDSGPQANSVEDGLDDTPGAQQFEEELQMIIEHAVNGEKQRIFKAPVLEQQIISSANSPFQLKVKLVDQPRIGITLTVNRRLTASLYEHCDPAKVLVDDIKRKIVEDSYNSSQLGLISGSNRLKIFQLGTVDPDSGEFEEFDFGDCLQAVGIRNNDTIYIRINDGISHDSSSSLEPSTEAQLRERINRINGRS